MSFVPYATGLISTYDTIDSGQLAICISAGTIFLININLVSGSACVCVRACVFIVIILAFLSQIMILTYAFRRQSLLHPNLVNNANIVRSTYLHHTLPLLYYPHTYIHYPRTTHPEEVGHTS